jgi:hypothetical protein
MTEKAALQVLGCACFERSGRGNNLAQWELERVG